MLLRDLWVVIVWPCVYHADTIRAERALCILNLSHHRCSGSLLLQAVHILRGCNVLEIEDLLVVTSSHVDTVDIERPLKRLLGHNASDERVGVLWRLGTWLMRETGAVVQTVEHLLLHCCRLGQWLVVLGAGGHHCGGLHVCCLYRGDRILFSWLRIGYTVIHFGSRWGYNDLARSLERENRVDKSGSWSLLHLLCGRCLLGLLAEYVLDGCGR